MATAAERPAFFCFLCPDSYLWEEQLKTLLAQFPPTSGQWEKKSYWGDEDPPPSFWEEFNATGLFGTFHYLLVHQAEKWGAKHWNNIDIMIHRLSPFCWPIFCLEGAWEWGKPKLNPCITKSKCFTIAEKKGWIWKHEGITEKTLRSYLAQQQPRYPNLPKPVFDKLALQGITDARTLENELRKLTIYYDGQKTMPEGEWGEVREQECNFFSCINHIKAGKIGLAIKDVLYDREVEKVFFILLSMLDREFRLLWELKTGQTTVKGPSKVYKENDAKAVSLPTLAKAMSVLLEADWSVKRGEASVAQALDTLLVDLSTLFAKK
ncbi:MAG: hypothetical protein IJS54_01975 [Desulfovibrio sp.]|nr:hypothetical protein [Desulfovibrio sp.]